MREPIFVRLDRFSAHLSGSIPAIFTAARVAKVPAMRRVMATGEVSVPINFVDDLLCQLQYGQGHPVYLTDQAAGDG